MGAPGTAQLDEAARRLSEAGVEVHLDASGDVLAARARTLIKSPGVPRTAPPVRAALDRGMPVLGELELAWRLLPNEFVAVTGTNGKTTTTEWIGHIHRRAGAQVAVAGNVGTAVSSLIGTLDPRTTVVCETSSFQLEDALAFAPEAAVLLNIAPDHLDRHAGYEAYVEAKLRVFAGQDADDVAVLPEDIGLEPGGRARKVTFGSAAGATLCERGSRLYWHEEPLIGIDEISLPGAHNRQNAMAAAAVCISRGLDAAAVADGLSSFTGVAHRLELIAERDGIEYVNDSKATNVASTLVALATYPGGVHLIAGGRGKGQDFAPLRAAVAERCRAVYLIGEAAADLRAALAPGDVPVSVRGDLEHAVRAAAAAAQPGETVLLSPACASYDQYPDFEARGEHFRQLVEAL